MTFESDYEPSDGTFSSTNIHTASLTLDALMGCGTTSMPELAGGKEGKCECAALGGEAELEESGRCCAAWCEYRPDISWSCSSRPPSDPAAFRTFITARL